MNFLGLKGLSDWSVIMVLDVIDGCLSQTPFAIYKWLSFWKIFRANFQWFRVVVAVVYYSDFGEMLL